MFVASPREANANAPAEADSPPIVLEILGGKTAA